MTPELIALIAATDYLCRKHREAIAEAYLRGYGKHPTDSDLDGWADQGTRPDE